MMRAILQRVKSASVDVDSRTIAEIGPGLLVLLGAGKEDNESDVDYLADKIKGLRIFHDDRGKMNHSIVDTGGEVLVVSQFTLYGDARKGRRPSFDKAAAPEMAESLYKRFIANIEAAAIKVSSGEFGAMMDVSLVNSGPVTILLDSKKQF